MYCYSRDSSSVTVLSSTVCAKLKISSTYCKDHPRTYRFSDRGEWDRRVGWNYRQLQRVEYSASQQQQLIPVSDRETVPNKQATRPVRR